MSAPDNEVHPYLSSEELKEIKHFRDKIAYKEVSKTPSILYRMVMAGELTIRQFELCLKYLKYI